MSTTIPRPRRAERAITNLFLDVVINTFLGRALLGPSAVEQAVATAVHAWSKSHADTSVLKLGTVANAAVFTLRVPASAAPLTIVNQLKSHIKKHLIAEFPDRANDFRNLWAPGCLILSLSNGDNEDRKIDYLFSRQGYSPEAIEKTKADVREHLAREAEAAEAARLAYYRGPIELLKPISPFPEGTENKLPVVATRNTEPVPDLLEQLIADAEAAKRAATPTEKPKRKPGRPKKGRSQ